ncbi:MAG: hypothetical protein VXW32_16145, partial [Myxococcota bacterium]|nr:hypothetical protein [Myxococcota bacterium]
MNQKSMLQEMGDQTQAVSYRARLAREFIAQYPDVRPLPVGTDVVGTLLEEAGFEAALLVALRLREGAESDAALDQVLDQWPTDFRAHAAVTVGFVRLGRFDEAVRSMVDEFQSYFEKDRPIDRILLCGWGTHLARCLYKMGWDRYLVVQKESLRISSGRPQLGLNLLRDALSLAEGTEEALQFRDRILGAYQTTYLLQRSDLARESKQLHFPEDTSAQPARLNSGVVD